MSRENLHKMGNLWVQSHLQDVHIQVYTTPAQARILGQSKGIIAPTPQLLKYFFYGLDLVFCQFYVQMKTLPPHSKLRNMAHKNIKTHSLI